MADSATPDEAQPSADDDRSSIGQIVRAARESKGLTIDELAAELRLERRLIEALEASRFDEFGAPVFAKGYLKQYGTRLGLRYEDLLGAYYDHVGATEVTIAPSQTIKLRDEKQITVWVLAALVIALLVVLLLVWWVDDEIVAVTEPASGAFESVASAVSDDEIAVTAGAVVPSESRAATAIPSSVADDAEDAVESGDAANVGEDAVPPGHRLIEIRFRGESWTEITDAAGQRLYVGLAADGSYERMTGQPPVDVLFGNADAVDLAVDGLSFPLPAGSRNGNLARFVIPAAPASGD
jgi:cytoskeleton protein RodZ